ncbi:hypothetical protein HYPDE_23278 [Hyphomicrobium denitrificans 1NES1]|uniref:Uncharacterized protein n=1 Tax=Hyphomicrobium denitrificans 1NES1 TaxID=670307 RepID=N0B2C0_9HYPH|nr:hypothetical protein HYPDE_23278 [Hyphomicrobium denitrificans 1NES1]
MTRAQCPTLYLPLISQRSEPLASRFPSREHWPRSLRGCRGEIGDAIHRSAQAPYAPGTRGREIGPSDVHNLRSHMGA